MDQHQLSQSRTPATRQESFAQWTSDTISLFLALVALATPGKAVEISFPVATTVGNVFTPSYYQYVERDEFRFTKQFGGLSINAANYDGNHPTGGGLYVGIMGLETTLVMQRQDGQPFSLNSLTILERNSPTGLSLTLGAKPHGSLPGDSIEEEFAFDRDTATYDTFDVLAANDRFASVDYVTFVSVESPFVDPSATNYIIDSIVTSPSGPVGPVISADFNEDNEVDHYDLEIWNTNYGDTSATLAQGDSDANARVDGGDFLNWQRQFDGTEIDALTASVPEPTALAFSLTSIAFVVVQRRSHGWVTYHCVIRLKPLPR